MKENGNLRVIKNAIYGKAVEAHTLIECQFYSTKKRRGPHSECF
jgi:hypothetical protein